MGTGKWEPKWRKKKIERHCVCQLKLTYKGREDNVFLTGMKLDTRERERERENGGGQEKRK